MPGRFEEGGVDGGRGELHWLSGLLELSPQFGEVGEACAPRIGHPLLVQGDEKYIAEHTVRPILQRLSSRSSVMGLLRRKSV